MKTTSKIIQISGDRTISMQSITHLVKEFLENSEIRNGLLTVYYKHTTGAVIIGEYEAGIVADLQDALESMAPSDAHYHHHLREVDFNGYAHIRSAFTPTSVTIPVIDSNLTLGTHQEIIVIDNQPEALPRFVLLHIMGA
jgi:secondary thiamine-phosphate synthase enzyme